MDMGFELSLHTRAMLKEREIREEWVWLAVDNPDWTKKGDDNNIHYFKSILEHGERILHVVVNHNVLPKKVVTVFFDRKTRR